jgi:hypothetical protein
VLLSAYRSHLHLGGLPAAASDAVRSSVAGGVAVAHEVHSAALLVMTRAAFVHGLDVMLAVCAIIALASALLALAFLPRRPAAASPAGATGPGETAGLAGPAATPVASAAQNGDNRGHERDRHR